MGEIFFNSCILQDLFLIGLFWLGLSVGHKIFPYMLMHGGQAMSVLSKVRLSSSDSLRQLHILSIYSSHLVQEFVVFKVQPSALRWNHWLLFYRCYALNVQARLTSSLGLSLLPNMDDFIKTTELPLSKTKLMVLPFKNLRKRWPPPRPSSHKSQFIQELCFKVPPNQKSLINVILMRGITKLTNKYDNNERYV